MKNKKNFIALIPARGGSKGIKNKNIKNFYGKPLIAWTIEEALKCNEISQLYLSTDSKKIINICKKYKNLEIIERPKKYSKSNSLMLDVVKHFLKSAKLKNKKFNGLILLQPTSPLRNFIDIKRSCRLFKKYNPDSLLSVCELSHQYNPESIYIKKKYLIKRYNNSVTIPLRQKKPKYFSGNGAAIYITHKKNLNKFIVGGKKIIGYEMPLNRSIDIDNLFQFKIAELIKKYGI